MSNRRICLPLMRIDLVRKRNPFGCCRWFAGRLFTRDKKADRRPPAIRLLTWFLLLHLCALLNVSHAANFTINGFAPSEGQITGVVGPDGTVWLTLKSEEPKVMPVVLTLTKFRDGKGESITVGFHKQNDQTGHPGAPATVETRRQVSVNGRYTIKLDTSGVIAGREYSGEISVAPNVDASGAKTFQVFSIRLNRVLVVPLIYQTVTAEATEVSVSVPVDGIASIQFSAGSDEYLRKNAFFALGTFVSETDGRVAHVFFKDAAGTDDKVAELSVPLDVLRLRLALDASEIPFDDMYVGELTIKIDDQDFPPMSLKLTRHATTRDAELVVGQPAPIELLCWGVACSPEDPVEVDMWEQSGKHPITGISLATVSSEGIEGYVDPLRYLSVKFLPPSPRNEKADERAQQPGDLWLLDSGDTADLQRRSIASGSQGKLRISFKKGLSPGEYKIPFQVRALNIDNAKSPKLTVRVRVKRPELYPLLVLFFAVLISYVLTKIIRTQLQRIDLKKRISRIRDADWFRRDWSIIPVVLTKALLAQVEKALDHSRWFKYLFFPSSLTEHVTAVEKRLPHLKRLCQLIGYWEKAGHDRLVRRRAKKVLGHVVDAFVDTPLHAELDASIITRLENLEEWKDPAKLVGHYWLSLKGDIMLLQSQVRLSDYYFGVDFNDSRNKLETFLMAQNLQDFDKTSTALQKFQEALGQQIAPGLKSVISEASKMLVVIKPSSLKIIIKAFQIIEKTLNEIDDNGPMPVMEAVKIARDHVNNSALVSSWSCLEQLDKIIESSPGLGDDQPGAELLDLLEKIACWKPAQLNSTLDSLQKDLNESQDSDRESARRLLAELRPDDQPKNLKETIEREIFYARLKVINSTRGDLRKDLLRAERENRPLEDLFSMVDGRAWEQLQTGISVDVKADQKAAFNPIYFNILVTDADARNSYLYKHGAIYDWEIQYDPGSSKGRLTQSLRVKTDRPSVVQFIPAAAKNVKATVVIRYDGREKEVISELSFNVGRPTMFGIVAAFRTVELVALAIALVVAVITGMQSQVYQNALSGSLAAYLALFGWGFAADQIKNLLEHIRTLMGAEG